MFRKPNSPTQEDGDQPASSSAPKKGGAPTVIASDVNMLGSIISDGVVDMDGHIDGSIKAAQITVRGNGVVKGDIIADTVHVYGEVKGTIKAKTAILYSSCRVEGIIMHESLTIEDGAFVDGKFKRSDKVAANDDEETEGFETTEVGPRVIEADLRGLKIIETTKRGVL